MELNNKCLDILMFLRQQDGYTEIKTLSKKYNISERAIRYNIDKIENFLVKNGYDYIEKIYQKGIKLPKNPKLNSFIDNFSNQHTPYQYVYSQEERFRYILVYLLQTNEAVRLDFFQKKLCISKNTVLKELNKIQEWLKERTLLLEKKSNIGVYIEGREYLRRNALSEILFKTLSSQDILKYLNKRFVQSKIKALQLETLFSQIDFNILDSLVRIAEQMLNKVFSDETYSDLITHLAIMIKRIQLNQFIRFPIINSENIMQTKEYEVASKMQKEIEKKYKIDIPLNEINYLTLHLLVAKSIKSVKKDDSNDGLYQVSLKMTNEIEKIYNVDFGAIKDEIVMGLIAHLRPTMYKIKYNLNCVNPLYEEIVLNYNKLFINTRIVSKYFEDYIQHSISDHEISYLALHFGAALVRMNKRLNNKAKIILVCGIGIGTAKMIASKIDELFNVEIIDIISSRSINEIDKSKVDYIISTVDLPDINNNSYIKISPLFLKKDYEKIKEFLHLKYRPKDIYSYEINTVNNLINIVEKYCTIDDKNQLQYEFMYQLMNNEQLVVERSYIKVLRDLITRDVISLNVKCKDWIEAIEVGTKLLEEKGYITKDYKNKIKDSFNELGPYMVVAPGICLAHSRPDDGVHKLSMSLVTLEKPIRFGSDLNDPVKIIITLAAENNESHLEALSQLMNLFMNNNDFQKILNATKKEEVLEIINNYSN